ncbi:MAG: D-alanine--D-alanine ligase [Deltaproteobacteria bacterium]|nr:D-alanine--D-alanine ligase [Deltaproteobacteria bacterium]
MKKIRVALICGGWSSEKEVSIKSGEAVFKALNKLKYDIKIIDPRNNLNEIISSRAEIDIAFILLHGKYGEDGSIQGLFELLGIPYVGSGVLASAMSMNKKVSKDVYRKAGLGVGKDVVLRKGEGADRKEIVKTVGLPAIVKPLTEGSSIGISFCATEESLEYGIEKAFGYDSGIIIEEYIDGVEITCCVIGNSDIKAFPIIEIIPKDKHIIFDYEAKYRKGETEEICPARISSYVQEKVIEYAVCAHKALGCRVWSRSDMIIKDKRVVMLETNTIPGMTENSLFPLAARTAGLSLSDLADKLISLSLDRDK